MVVKVAVAAAVVVSVYVGDRVVAAAVSVEKCRLLSIFGDIEITICQ